MIDYGAELSFYHYSNSCLHAHNNFCSVVTETDRRCQ